MDSEIIKYLEEKFDYDFDSDFFTDEIIIMISEVIEATKEVCIKQNNK